jgi:hypothetical protein
VHVRVIDDGTAGILCVRDSGKQDEGGQGLHLVNEIATRWGFLRDRTGTCCWFDLGDVGASPCAVGISGYSDSASPQGTKDIPGAACQ